MELTKYVQELSQDLLCAQLIWDESREAFVTTDNVFTFTETDKPVLSKRGIGRVPQPIHGRNQWEISFPVAGMYGQTDYETHPQAFDSLWDAVAGASNLLHAWKVKSVATAIGELEAAEMICEG